MRDRLTYFAVALLSSAVWSLALLTPSARIDAADDPATDNPPASADDTPATEPADQPSGPARPADSLAGDLTKKRAEENRKDDGDLLDSIDLAKDVVYRGASGPVPESEQFQFLDGVLRTPEKGDARLCLAGEVPKFYRLSLDLAARPEATDPAIGIGAILDGQPFFLLMRSGQVILSRFYDHEIAKPLATRPLAPDNPAVRGVVELLVGDCGVLIRNRSGFLEWIAPGSALSLDERWQSSAGGKLFLAFPSGQFDVRSIQVTPLERQEWIDQVRRLIPEGQIVSLHAAAEPAPIDPAADPVPGLDVLRPAVLRLAHRGDFEELERWADRLRKDEVTIDNRFGSEEFYRWLRATYVTPLATGSRGKLDGNYQTQFAFLEAWLEQKPDSVAARIVKAQTNIDYAWDARGGGFAREVPQEAWAPFKERLETADLVLSEAARLEPRDVCVFSTMLSVGTGLEWSRRQMERTVERGLQVSKKDFVLIDVMTNRLLPRGGGAPGDAGKFAQQLEQRVGGDDGLELYARVAKTTQVAEVHLKRTSGDPVAFAQLNRDFTKPTVVLEEFDADKLRSAIPIVRTRHPTAKSSMNYICWLSCVLDDQALAKELFAEIVDRPDLDIWGTRDNLDHWRHWCDPSVAEPSEFLPIEGEELATLRPYAEGAAKIDFLLDNQTLLTGSALPASTIKLWSIEQKRLVRQVETPDALGKVADLWLLDSGQLFVPMHDAQKMTMVQYEPPNYIRGAFPATYFGMPFNIISDDAQCAGVATKSKIFLVNVKQRKQQQIAVPPLASAGINCDGKYVAGVADKIYVWESMTGEQLFTIDVKPKLMEFLRDGSAIGYTTDDKLGVWDIAGNRERFSIPLDAHHTVGQFRGSLDGRWLVTAEARSEPDGSGERHVVAVYDLKQPAPIHVFTGHQQPIAELAIARNAGRLASSSTDGVVKVWDLAAATEKSETKEAASDEK